MITPTVIQIDVMGEPAGQPRIKSRVIQPKGGGKAFAHHYTPTTSAKAWKQLIYLAAVGRRPRVPHVGPVRVDWECWFPRTQQLLRPSVPDTQLPHIVKPDRDNVEKVILDALTEAQFWTDDSRVYAGKVAKYYCARETRPGARIIVTLEEDTWSPRPRSKTAPTSQTGLLLPS